MKQGFKPVYDSNSMILILGSFPSEKSIKEGFYYYNKQNRFWKMLSTTFGEDIGDSIEEKKAFLLAHNIALWDVLDGCNIKGSSDNDITLENSSPVALDKLFYKTNIKKIICNGKKAFELFNIHFKNFDIPAICLPSTSPANVRFDMSKWSEELK